MSVYAKDNPVYLDEALYSIWNEQTLKPGQIVLVADGPLSEQLNICIADWREKLNELLTITVLSQNSGLGVALNTGLQHCRYELVGRMDADDVSLPCRFEKQVAFMLANPGISASSAVLEEWDESLSFRTGIRTLPQKSDDLEIFAKFRNPLNHPLTVFRKSDIVSVGGYPLFRTSQDWALWSLLLVRGYKLANLPDILYKQRTGESLMGRRGLNYFKNEVAVIKYQYNLEFITLHEYIMSIIIRFVTRVSPGLIKNILYKSFRK
jgi:glycosyltransferase involved in cell wall biosynthesis